MEDKYMSLITEYIDGTLTPQREEEFNQYVKEGHILMEEVEALMQMQAKIETAERPMPSEHLKTSFYAMLNEAQKSASNASEHQEGFLELLNKLFFGSPVGKMAFAIVILVVGIFAGRGLGKGQYEKQMTSLTGQVTDMQEMIMVSMLENKSVSDRLQGIQMSNKLVSTNKTVTDALFVTLGNDESTNVRMAALNTLSQYADDPAIREGLINSILKQESPLMQVALAELMVQLQEKKSVEQFKELLGRENTPEEIKTTLQESIDKIM